MIEKLDVIAIGLQPPPTNGQALAFEVAVEALENSILKYVVIDISEDAPTRKTGSFSLARVFKIITKYLYFLKKLVFDASSDAVVYLNIGFSKVGFLRDVLFIWTTKLFGRKIVLHAHGGGYDELWGRQSESVKNFMSKTINLGDAVIVLDDFSIQQFPFLEDKETKCHVVHNCIPSNLQTQEISKQYNSSQPFRILYMSNMMITKGYRDLLAAARLLLEKGLDVQVDFCGQFIEVSGSEKTSASYQKEFLAAIEEDPFLKEKVFFHGFVNGREKELLLKQAHISVLPTYYVNEGQPLTIIEAMAYGLPVITTNYRGLPSLVANGESGYIVSPRSPQELAEKITKLIKNQDLYKAMSIASLKRYESNHSYDKYQGSVLDIIKMNLDANNLESNRKQSKIMKETIRAFLPRTNRTYKILQGPLAGRRIFTNWHDYPAAIMGTTEKSLVNWFNQHVNQGETWLDVGAHFGYTAISLSELVGESGQVFAFEPMLASAGCIQKTRRLNNLPQLHVVPIALGNQSAIESEILPTTRGMVDNTITQDNEGWFERFYVTSLDSLWPQIGKGRPIHGIKIDVQGMEIETLRGMVELLRTYKPKLIVEIHDGVNRDEFCQLIDKIGYVNNFDLIDEVNFPVTGDELLSNYSYFFTPKQVDNVDRIEQMFQESELV